MTTGTACKTLAKASSLQGGAGSTYNFRAGDTWTGETLSLYNNGGGSFASPTFDSTYSSSFSSTNTACLGDSRFTNFKTARTNAGAGDSEATTDATEYCRRLAVDAALVAARDAAESASTWNKIQRYGTGANPIFDGNNAQQWCIELSGSSQRYQGGWKVDSVDLKNCTVAGIRAENVITGVRGLWVTGSTIDHITGVAFNTTTHTLNTPIPGYSHFTALGIDEVGVQNTFLDNLTITNTDTPFFVLSANDNVIDTVTLSHSIYLHPYVGEFGSRTLYRNSITEFMCDTGLASGAAGVFVGVATDAILDNVDIRNNRGNGVDFEGHDVNATVLNSHIHLSNDAAFLEFTNTGQNTGTMIVDSTFDNNPTCTGCNAGLPNLVQTGGGAVITANKMLWIRNTVTKKSGHAFLFAGGDHTGPTDTITDWITQGVFGADNTVN